MYGDMGRHCGAPILPRLKIEAKDPENTAIIHVGDIAYDLHSDGGKVMNLLLVMVTATVFAIIHFVEW